MAELNIKLKNAELLSYTDDSTYYSGCPTCDCGSEYINDIQIITTNYIIDISITQMYSYAISQGDVIKIFATNLSAMTEEEFVEYVEKSFKNIVDNDKKIEIKTTKHTDLNKKRGM